MNISSVELVAPEMTLDMLAGVKTEANAGSFSNWLARSMDALNLQLQRSEFEVRQLAVGDEHHLHQVMLSLEKAKLEFELVLQVRNRLLEGYQEIMRMQV